MKRENFLLTLTLRDASESTSVRGIAIEGSLGSYG